MPLLGHSHARPDVIAHPFPAASGLDAGEQVKASLEPGGKPMCDLDGFMEGVIIWQHAVHLVFVALECVIAVRLNHGLATRYRVRAINLDLVAVLRVQTTGEEEHRRPRGSED